jgi:hypothetical protein
MTVFEPTGAPDPQTAAPARELREFLESALPGSRRSGAASEGRWAAPAGPLERGGVGFGGRTRPVTAALMIAAALALPG